MTKSKINLNNISAASELNALAAAKKAVAQHKRNAAAKERQIKGGLKSAGELLIRKLWTAPDATQKWAREELLAIANKTKAVKIKEKIKGLPALLDDYKAQQIEIKRKEDKNREKKGAGGGAPGAPEGQVGGQGG